METKHVAFLVVPESTLLDITGPYEVFAQANEYLQKEQKPLYRLQTISSGRSKLVKTASGMHIQCDDNIKTACYKIDTLFIPGVPNYIQDKYTLDKKAIQWINAQSKTVRRICSVCTGTFFLAEAGILTDKRVTTHWDMCDKLAKDYPETKVENDPIFVTDGNIYTSAGISAGMDLALALIEEDYGRNLALAVAKQMVLYLKRPGNQSQYSSVLIHQNTDYRPIQEIGGWIMEHLKDSLTVETLAEKASMSPRNFARVFVKETGITPARYIDKLRIETACRYLTETQLTLKEIASVCGLKTIDNMRRVFVKYMQTTPSEYRENFGSAFPDKSGWSVN